MPELRFDLEQLPERMAGLPIDARGYPVPWFVPWIDTPEGRMPEFRAMDNAKFVRAIRERLCWVCGQRLGVYLAFTIGPMCGVNRISSEPPAHVECAQWSTRNCPFLSKPQMVRRETGPGVDYASIKENVAGVSIPRNPGVTLLWVCLHYEVVPDGKGKFLLSIGAAERVEWWSCGRPATLAEVIASVESGLPLLLEAAKQERGGLAAITRQLSELEALYPPAETVATIA